MKGFEFEGTKPHDVPKTGDSAVRGPENGSLDTTPSRAKHIPTLSSSMLGSGTSPAAPSSERFNPVGDMYKGYLGAVNVYHRWKAIGEKIDDVVGASPKKPK